jgi:hypothetical protein
MPININSVPYHDDFASEKGFLKILFKPGYSVQARELTQIQSILQKQISNLSDSLYKNGSMVVPGGPTIDIKVPYIKIKRSVGNSYNSVTDFIGRSIRNPTNGMVATVVYAEPSVDGVPNEPDTLYVKYTKGSHDGSDEIVFNIGDVLNTVEGFKLDDNGSITTIPFSMYQCEVMMTTTEDPSVGTGSISHIDNGIYYIDGNMVSVYEQTIVLDKYKSLPTYKLGLFKQEEIISVYDDPSLFDNAQGTTNYNSPGADRYKVSLLYQKIGYDEISSPNFIQLMSVFEGVLEVVETDREMLDITDTLARRTYDESGHYTVKPFGVDVRQYFKQGDNQGIINIGDITFDKKELAEEFVELYFKDTKMYDEVNQISYVHNVTTDDTIEFNDGIYDQNLSVDPTKYYPGRTHKEMMEVFSDYMALGIEGGNAYVFGYNVRSTKTKYIPYKRALDTTQRNNEYVNTGLGAYIYISDLAGMPSPGDYINFYNTPIQGHNCKFNIAEAKDGGPWYEMPTVNANQIHTNTFNPEDSEFDTSLYNTENNTSNTLNVRIVATAKVKLVEYVQSSGNISNGFEHTHVSNLGRVGAGVSDGTSSEELAVFKLFFYDLRFGVDPLGNTYTPQAIRSVSSRTSITNVWPFSASTLVSYMVNAVPGHSMAVKIKSLIRRDESLMDRSVGQVYYASGSHIMLKHFGSQDFVDGNHVDGVLFDPNEAYSLVGLVPAASGAQLAKSLTDDDIQGLRNDLIRLNMFARQIFGKDGDGSLVPLESQNIQTVRHVEELTSTVSNDTSYKFIRLYKGITPNELESGITLSEASFEKFGSYDPKHYYSHTTNSPGLVGGVHEITSGSVQFSNLYRTIKIPQNTVTGWTSSSMLIDLYVPIVKTQAQEKRKIRVDNVIELPYSLVSTDGTTLEGFSVGGLGNGSNLEQLITDAVGASFDVDMIGQNSTQYVTTGIMSDVVASPYTGKYTMKEVQLRKSDIYEVSRIYDTGIYTQIRYRINLNGDTEFINSMTVEQFQYAADAWRYFESAGLNPWGYQAPDFSGELSPFYEEMKTTYESSSNTVSWPGADSDDPFPLYDITSSYNVDNGQRPEAINLGALHVKRGITPCQGRMIVVYSYHEHHAGRFATVDSYINTDYDKLPSYKSRRLSGFFDFRPAAKFKAIENRVNGENDTSDYKIEVPINNSSIITDYRMYLSRKDVLILTGGGVFKVNYGISEINPQQPTVTEAGMILYELFAKAFTRIKSDVSLNMIDNRRYTMRDIGKIDKRVKVLEYYTSLTLLEKNASDMSILDVNGNDRYKNGFFVDPFDGDKMIDILDSDNDYAIDRRRGELRPHFYEKNQRMQFNAKESSEYACADNISMMPYEHVLVEGIENSKSSKYVNVNPYAVFSFRGTVTLTPENDDWRDVNKLPDLKIERDNYSAFNELATVGNLLGTVYGEYSEENVIPLATVNLNQTVIRACSGNQIGGDQCDENLPGDMTPEQMIARNDGTGAAAAAEAAAALAAQGQ